MTSDSWTPLIGQTDATRRLRMAVSSPVHAYMFVGPRGAGKRLAAQIFAGELLVAGELLADPGATVEAAARHRRLALKAAHPDIVVFAPSGNNLRLGSKNDPGEIPAIMAEASRSPTDATRKIVIVDEFQTADPPAASALLKLVEEPPSSTIFVLLTSDVPPHQKTIESRCLRLDFLPVNADAIAEVLVAEKLADPEKAALVAAAANGSVDRARLLVLDNKFAFRRETWWSVPERLNGRGAIVATVVDELAGLIDDAAKVKTAQHQQELEALTLREKQVGIRGSGRRVVEAQHRRALRQFRTDELRFGFATLAARYRELVVAELADETVFEAFGLLARCTDALTRNPNETLLLQALLLKLPSVVQPVAAR